MAKAIPADEQLVQQLFPTKGIDVAHLQEEQPPGTTPIGDNVRAYEMLTKRGRGGQRPGITKYLNMQVSGFHEIQLLDTITITDGAALGANFDTIELGDIGQLLFDLKYVDIVGGVGTYLTYFDNTVGYGFQSAKTGTRTLKLALHRDGSQYTLVATLKDGNGATVGGEDIVLFTNPSGRIGDNIHAITVTDISSPPNGNATWSVADDVNETVTYQAKATSDGIMSNVVTITWDGKAPSPPVPDEGGGGTLACNGLSITVRTTLRRIGITVPDIPEHTTSFGSFEIIPPWSVSPPGPNTPSGTIPGEGEVADGTWSTTLVGTALRFDDSFGNSVGLSGTDTVNCTVTTGTSGEIFITSKTIFLPDKDVVLRCYVAWTYF